MEELDGAGLAAVLAADTELQVGALLPPRRDGLQNERTDAGLVDRLERVVGEQALLQVRNEEARLGVVATHAEGGLGEVVRAEGKELGVDRDLAGGECGPRQLDHRAEEVRHVDAGLLHDFLGDPFEEAAQALQLALETDQWDHHLRVYRRALLGDRDGRLENRPHLHLVDLGVEDAKTAASQPQHGVYFAQRLDLPEQLLLLSQFR